MGLGREIPPWDLFTILREGACGLFGDIRTRGGTRQALTLHSLLEEMRRLRLEIRLTWLTWDPIMRALFSEFISKQQNLG